MKYFVYVLVSSDSMRTYVGQTDDVPRRLTLHNAGRVRTTKSRRPWSVLHIEEYESRAEAMARELWFKRPTGRKFISTLIKGGGLSDPAIAGSRSRSGLAGSD